MGREPPWVVCSEAMLSIAMAVVGAGGYLGGHLAAVRTFGTHDPSFGTAHGATTDS